MDAERVLADHTVIVDGGLIAALGPSAELAPPPGATVIDGGGRYLLPGLFDTHVHLNEEERDEHLALYLASGVTTVQSMHGGPHQLELRRRVAAGELSGPRILTTGPTTASERVDSPEKAQRVVREQQAAGYDAVKMYGDGADSMTRETYARLITAAHEAGLRVVGHAPRNHPFAVVLEAGQDSIDHMEEIVYTYQPIVDVIGPLLDLQFGRVEPDEVGDALAALPDLRPLMAPAVERLAAEALAAGLAVTPTLVAFETIWRQTTQQYAELLEAPETRYVSPLTRVDWGPDFNRYRTSWADRLAAVEQILRRSLELQMTIVRGFQDAGVPIMVGTDAPLTFVYPGFAVHRELALLAASGLTPYEALRAATATPAAELGIAADAGTVAVGKRADLVLVDADPLADVANAARVAGVAVNGRWLPRGELDRRLAALADAYAPVAVQVERLLPPYRERRADEVLRLYRETSDAAPELAALAERLVNAIGYDHLGSDDPERAVAVFRANAGAFPESANVWDSLGEAQMHAGDWEGALASYRRALELAPGSDAAARVAWVDARVAALASPPAPSAEELLRLAGDYGQRHVELRDGALFYHRDGGREYRLAALTADTFALEGEPTFRVRFEPAGDGRPERIVGLYSDGRTDESPRG
jgi:imidazolonepropionase-like amidohydrolase